MSSPDIKSMLPEELKELVLEIGQPAFRAKQLFEWIHVRRAKEYAGMTNLPAALRNQLQRDYPLVRASVRDRQVSAVDGTQKFLCSATASVYPPRSGAGWDAASARPPCTDWSVP